MGDDEEVVEDYEDFEKDIEASKRSRFFQEPVEKEEYSDAYKRSRHYQEPPTPPPLGEMQDNPKESVFRKIKRKYKELKGETYEPVKEEAKRAYGETAGRAVEKVDKSSLAAHEKLERFKQTRTGKYAGKVKDKVWNEAPKAMSRAGKEAASELTKSQKSGFFRRKADKWTKKDAMQKYAGLRRTQGGFSSYGSPVKARPNISMGVASFSGMSPTIQPRTSNKPSVDFMPKFNPVSVGKPDTIGPTTGGTEAQTPVKALEYEMRDLKDKIKDMNRIKRNPELYERFGGEEFDLEIRAYKQRLKEVRRWKNQLNHQMTAEQRGQVEDQPMSPYFVSIATPAPAYMGVRGQMVARQRVYEATNKSKIGDFMAGNEGLAPYMFGGVRGGVKFGSDFSGISPTVQLRKKEQVTLSGAYTGVGTGAGTRVNADHLSNYLARPRTTTVFNAIPKSQGKTISVSRGTPRSNSAAAKGKWNFGSLNQYVIKGRRKKK